MTEFSSKYEFSIHGRDKRTAILMLIIGLFAMPGYIIYAYLYPHFDIAKINFIQNYLIFEIGLIVLMIVTFMGCEYAAYFLWVKKTLKVTNSEIIYLVHERVKQKILLMDISKVKVSQENSKQFFLRIYDSNTIIEFSTTLFKAKKKELKKAFKEILKYQPKYNFKVEDKIGWSKK